MLYPSICPGPVGSVLAAWIGTRATVMIGGFFVTTGMLCTMFMESFFGIILTWGVLTGRLGYSLIISGVWYVESSDIYVHKSKLMLDNGSQRMCSAAIVVYIRDTR